MKRKPDNEDYPAVHSWNYITVEGYCMLNMEFRMCHDRYNYRLNPDRTFTRMRNERYDPKSRKENQILTPKTVSVQSDLRASNAGISHGAILMMNNTQPSGRSVRL